ncbi:hypothetical protein [Methanosarcina siciliae]|uniref:hypothetical protein n=2 Tax=Methanosarcina siciliae TaxID=38027 RepID=UPI0012E0097C|nr:hypothetical protein [Methanosarcina siciliae]
MEILEERARSSGTQAKVNPSEEIAIHKETAIFHRFKQKNTGKEDQEIEYVLKIKKGKN